MNSEESVAMWKIYASSGAGIAVSTTFKGFKESVRNTDIAVSGGIVHYDDHKKLNDSEDSNVIEWGACKRSCFDYEREFRGIVYGSGIGPPGIAVPIDIATLIQEVFISPLSPDWVVGLVKALLKRINRINRDTSLFMLTPICDSDR